MAEETSNGSARMQQGVTPARKRLDAYDSRLEREAHGLALTGRGFLMGGVFLLGLFSVFFGVFVWLGGLSGLVQGAPILLMTGPPGIVVVLVCGAMLQEASKQIAALYSAEARQP